MIGKSAAQALIAAADVEIAAADRLLCVAYVARRMGVSARTVRDWAQRERIIAIRTPGGYYRIPASELDRLLSTHKHGEV